MRFLADENVDSAIVERLRQEGHAVTSVIEMATSPRDNQVIRLANDNAALLLTADKDFGELVFRQGQVAHGVVLMRLSGLSPQNKAEVVATAVREHATELPRSFAVISPGAVRLRRCSRRGVRKHMAH